MLGVRRVLTTGGVLDRRERVVMKGFREGDGGGCWLGWAAGSDVCRRTLFCILVQVVFTCFDRH